MDKLHYVNKFEEMTKNGIRKGVYETTYGTTLDNLRIFLSFLRGNFKKYELHDKMRLVSNQLARLYGTAKTQMFYNVTEISSTSFKFRPIQVSANLCFNTNAT